MADLLTEAVEAAARALSVHWRDMHTNEALGRQRMLAEAALAAAAPIIRRQVAEEIAEALADEAGRVSDEEGAGAAAEHAITGAVGALWRARDIARRIGGTDD